MKKLAIFYHCLLYGGNPPDLLPNAYCVVNEQMQQLKDSGLLNASVIFVAGINGGNESSDMANMVLPAKAQRIMHGLQSRSENLTIALMHDWAQSNPDWYVLYFHSKSATKTEPYYREHGNQWRRCMMRHCVTNWRQCVKDLDSGFESVGCHWLTNMGSDRSQNYWAGTIYWVKSDFLRTIPSIYTRQRIKMSGIDSLESRYEAEAFIGTGPRLPLVKDYHPVNPSMHGACMWGNLT